MCFFSKSKKRDFFSFFFELLNTSLELSVSADRSVLHSILVHKKLSPANLWPVSEIIWKFMFYTLIAFMVVMFSAVIIN